MHDQFSVLGTSG